MDSMTGDVSGSNALADRPPIDVAVAVHPVLFGEILSRALARLPGLRVVSCGRGGDEVDRILESKPRVVLLDGDDLEGIPTLLRRLNQAAPATRVLVMATKSSRKKLERLLRAGACGIVETASDLETLVKAIGAVAAGRVWATRFPASPGSNPALANLPARGSDGRLTRREWEIAERVGQGLRNRDIAIRLNISPDTVKTHLNNIFRKLDLDGRIALGIRARRRIEPKTDV